MMVEEVTVNKAPNLPRIKFKKEKNTQVFVCAIISVFFFPFRMPSERMENLQ
jgi:hypothetical protein